MKIGIISDTHSTFDEKLKRFLADVDIILHAGDIGNLEVADDIAAYKKMVAVYGNIDDYRVRSLFKEYEYFELEGVTFLMTHIGGFPRSYTIGAECIIRERRPRVFISGHSHILRVMNDKEYNLLHINPGAAGIYGFHRVRTAVRLTVENGEIKDLEVGEWQR